MEKVKEGLRCYSTSIKKKMMEEMTSRWRVILEG